MSRTVFYALDPARLSEEQQELADLFAQLHALTSDQPDGLRGRVAHPRGDRRGQ